MDRGGTELAEMFVLDRRNDIGMWRMFDEIKRLFGIKNELEHRLGVEDRGARKSFYEGTDSKFYGHKFCGTRLHIVVDQNKNLRHACPQCLIFIKDPVEDAEEAWLRKNLK